MLAVNDMIKSAGPLNMKELSEQDIKDVQETILLMMEYLDLCFSKYNIKYYLGGGSALGAQRHKGFIPWDEDLDVNMPRKDYNRLISLFKKNTYLNELFDLSENTFDHRFDVNFMKIKLKNTVYEEYLYQFFEEKGIFIDIFPMENTYGNKLLRSIHGLMSTGMLFLTSCKRTHDKYRLYIEFSDDPKYQKAINMKKKIGAVLSFASLNWWLGCTNKVLSFCKNDNSRYITVPTGRKHFFGEIYERKTIMPFKRMSFEHLSLCVAHDNHAYMSKLFGNYMVIPKEEDREMHLVCDLACNKEVNQKLREYIRLKKY